MSRVKKVKLELEGADDPVAVKVNWGALSSSSANFKTQKINKNHGRIHVGRSKGSFAFNGFFVIVGALVLGGGISSLFSGDFAGAFFATACGAIFISGGIFFSKMRKDFVMDLDGGHYFFGGKYDVFNALPREQQGAIADIHAIQLLKKYVRGDIDSAGYANYELNLVFKDAKRINIMINPTVADNEAAALLIGDTLNVPIWTGVE